jgi:hypothetical protein
MINIQKLIKAYPDIEVYPGYCESGKLDEGKFIFVSDWNRYDKKLIRALELNGEIEWSDQVTGCSRCGLLIQTGHDSYFYKPQYVIGDGEILCSNCIKDNSDSYIEELINNPDKAHTLDNIRLEDFGFEQLNKEYYEFGQYGSNDKPYIILKEYKTKYPDKEFIFDYMPSQFATRFNIYGRDIEGLKELKEKLDELQTEMKELEDMETSDQVDEMLDSNGPIKIAGCEYYPSQILKEVDPTNYRQVLLDFNSGLIEDLVEEIEEVKRDIVHLYK